MYNCNNERFSTQPIDNIYVEIVEQPASKTLRFRYQCEGRSAGSIPGINSSSTNKTFPAIKIVGYSGAAVVVVSCVTKDKPYRPHPHNLVGKDVRDKGVLTVHFDAKSVLSFNNLGIQCVRRNEVENSLNMRESLKIDPFRTGYGHRSRIKELDLNVVRLCFQTYLKKDKLVPLKPIVSEPIFDKKSKTDLIVADLSDTSSPVTGGKKIILLCEKVVKEDIAVRFFEEIDGVIVWEDRGIFNHKNVFRQTAISFKTPKYKLIDVESPVNVFIQLLRPSDGMTSEPLAFQFIPDQVEISIKRKRRRKVDNVDAQEILNYIQENEQRFMGNQSIDTTQMNAFNYEANATESKNEPSGSHFHQQTGAFYQMNPYLCTGLNCSVNCTASATQVGYYNAHSAGSSQLANWNTSQNTTINNPLISNTNQSLNSNQQSFKANFPMQHFPGNYQNENNFYGKNDLNIPISAGAISYANPSINVNEESIPSNQNNEEIESMTDSFSKLL